MKFKKLAFGLLPTVAVLLLSATSSFAQSPPSGTTDITGTLTITVLDDFPKAQSKTLFEVDDPEHRMKITLQFADGLPKNLRTGDRVRARGALSNSVLKLHKKDIQLEARAAPKPVATAFAPNPENTIAIAVDFQDATVSCSIPNIDASIFGSVG